MPALIKGKSIDEKKEPTLILSKNLVKKVTAILLKKPIKLPQKPQIAAKKAGINNPLI